MQGVEGVEELFLDAFFALEELDVVDEQHVHVTVAALERHSPVVAKGVDEVVGELFGRHVLHPHAGEQPLRVMARRVEQVGFSEAGFSPDEQRVVGPGRCLGDGDGRGVRKAVRGTDDKRLEGVLGVQTGVAAGIARRAAPRRVDVAPRTGVGVEVARPVSTGAAVDVAVAVGEGLRRRRCHRMDVAGIAVEPWSGVDAGVPVHPGATPDVVYAVGPAVCHDRLGLGGRIGLVGVGCDRIDAHREIHRMAEVTTEGGHDRFPQTAFDLFLDPGGRDGEEREAFGECQRADEREPRLLLFGEGVATGRCVVVEFGDHLAPDHTERIVIRIGWHGHPSLWFVTNCPHRYPQVWRNSETQRTPERVVAIPPRVDSLGEVNRHWPGLTTDHHMLQVKARIWPIEACRPPIPQVAARFVVRRRFDRPLASQ